MTLPGGPANKLGNRYEKLWTVHELLRLIEGETNSIRIEPPGIDKVEFVVHRGEVKEFHQAKRNNPQGDWSIASLNRIGIIPAIKKLLSDENARFVFVSGSAASDLENLRKAAEDAASVEEFVSEFLKAKTRQRSFKQIREAWDCDEATAVNYLRRVEIRTIDELSLEEKVESVARALFLADPISVWDRLSAIAEHSVHHTVQRDNLVETMRKQGLVQRRVSRPEQAVGATRQTTDSYLQEARRKLIHGKLLSREASEEVQKRIDKPATVIVGKPGAGKTACTVEVVDGLLDQGLQVLAFRLDRHVAASNTKNLGQRLGLEESPVPMLAAAAEASGKAGVLVVDQLDAVSTMSGRSSEALDLVENLLEEVEAMRAQVNIHVIVICRSFDWENDHRLRRLIRKPDAKILVDELTDDEAKQLLDEGGFDPSKFRKQQLRLLRTPQNLSLFLEAGFDKGGVPAFDTVMKLFDQYWTKKRLVMERASSSNDYWRETLRLLCTEMTEKQELSVRREILDRVPQWYLDQMTSEGVLAFDDKRYGFGHESFFDYCYARVVFLPDSESLTSTLCASEQHLFRRGQVRQILTYVRDADFNRYLTEVRTLLSNSQIRTHIKDLVFALLADVPYPKVEEWEIWEKWTKPALETIQSGVTNGDKTYRLAWNRLSYSQPWFKFLASSGRVERWLNSGNDGLTNMAVGYLSFHQSHSPDIAARLLEPHADKNGDWPRRLKHFAEWADPSGHRRLFELLLHLIDNGTLDNAKGPIAVNSTFWSLFYGLEKKRPEWVGELLAHRLRRQASVVPKKPKNILLSEWLLEHDPNTAPTTADMFIEAAEVKPQAFVKHMLPVVLEVSDSMARDGAPPRLDAIWWYPITTAHPDTKQGCLDALARAVAKLAEKAETEECAKVIAELRHRDTYVANLLLLALYRGAPELFADETVTAVRAEPWRFYCGFSDNPYWYAMETISAVAPNCTRKNLDLLQDAILEYVPQSETSAEGKKVRGLSQFSLLSAVPEKLRNKRAQKRLQELKRKFDEPPGEPKKVEAGMVESPISSVESEKMTDEQWLKAIRKYSSTGLRHKDGKVIGEARELSRTLETNVKKNPERFAHLALSFETGTNPMYMQHTLSALSKAELDDELKLSVCRKAFSEFRKDCGKQIADVVGSISGRLPNDAVNMLDWLATKHPDPQQEKQQKDAPSGNQHWRIDWINTAGINSVRGCAAVAIRRLVRSNSTNWQQCRKTVDRMLKDKSTAVLSCVAEIIESVAITDPDGAMALFLKMNVPTESLLATNHMFRFMECSLADKFEELRPTIEKMIRSGEEKVGKRGSTLAGLAVLYDHDAGGLVDEALGRGMAWRLGIAKVAASNIKKKECRDWCEKKLAEFFEDEHTEVREEAASCFSNLENEPLEKYESLIYKFSDSKAFSNYPYSILKTLKQSCQQLPGMTCIVCERFLQKLSARPHDMTERAYSEISRSLTELAFRTYQQHQKGEWGSRALDLIDRLCLENLPNTSKQFESFER